MGNVMVDIARWLLQDDPQRKTEEVIVVARRGPFEAKFDEKGVVLGFREAKVVMLGNENNPWGMAQH
jgi:hypothetical protein